MDPVKIGLVGYGGYPVAPLIRDLDVLEATRVSVDQDSMQDLGAEL